MIGKVRVGIIAESFQPLHIGHLRTLRQALDENNQIFVLIRATGNWRPFSPTQRHYALYQQLSTFRHATPWQIIILPSYIPNKLEPIHFQEFCDLNNNSSYTLYSHDNYYDNQGQELKTLGIIVKKIVREKFWYKPTTHPYYQVSSGREIRALHARLKEPIALGPFTEHYVN